MLGNITLRVDGVNLAKTLQSLKESYDLKSIQKLDSTSTKLTIPINYYPKIIDYFESKCYNVHVIRFSPLLRFCIFLHNFWVQIVLLLICMIALVVLSNIALGITFRVDNEQCNQQITAVLHSNGVMGKWMSSVDVDMLEQSILHDVPQISLVNIAKRGCFLVVNYTLKTDAMTIEPSHSGPIVAQSGGIVSKVFVVRGTALVNVGAYVTAGQVLIADYFVDKDGNTVGCPAEGQVYVYTWQSNTVEFCEDTIEYVPTGNEVTCSTLQFLGSNVLCGKQNIPFEHYSVETEESYLCNVCIPIKIVKTHYLETTPQRVHQDFESKLDALKMQASEELLRQIDASLVLEEKYTISSVGDVHFVTYYVKSESLIT